MRIFSLVVHQDPVGGTLHVIELAGTNSPPEGPHHEGYENERKGQ